MQGSATQLVLDDVFVYLQEPLYFQFFLPLCFGKCALNSFRSDFVFLHNEVSLNSSPEHVQGRSVELLKVEQTDHFLHLRGLLVIVKEERLATSGRVFLVVVSEAFEAALLVVEIARLLLVGLVITVAQFHLLLVYEVASHSTF